MRFSPIMNPFQVNKRFLLYSNAMGELYRVSLAQVPRGTLGEPSQAGFLGPPRLGSPAQIKAEQSNAKAKQSKEKQSKQKKSKAKQSEAMQSTAM